MTVIAWLFALMMLTQGAFLALTPERAIRYTLWKTRLIGARVAAPGRGTMLFYRIQGLAIVLASLFILFKLISE